MLIFSKTTLHFLENHYLLSFPASQVVASAVAFETIESDFSRNRFSFLSLFDQSATNGYFSTTADMKETGKKITPHLIVPDSSDLSWIHRQRIGKTHTSLESSF